MITERDLQEAIAACEGEINPNANTCIKLAAFYALQDKKFPVKYSEPGSYSQASRPASKKAEYESDTEFGRIVRNIPTSEVLAVMDELMQTLQVLNPRLYAGVMRKLEN